MTCIFEDGIFIGLYKNLFQPNPQQSHWPHICRQLQVYKESWYIRLIHHPMASSSWMQGSRHRSTSLQWLQLPQIIWGNNEVTLHTARVPAISIILRHSYCWTLVLCCFCMVMFYHLVLNLSSSSLCSSSIF